jgi:predicted RNA-binding Zn-ribbon protein involved in translation (DUF1610 family)
MRRNKKIDLQKVLASFDIVCPKCRHVITPSEVRRIDFEQMQCPACGEVFMASKRTSPQQ